MTILPEKSYCYECNKKGEEMIHFRSINEDYVGTIVCRKCLEEGMKMFDAFNNDSSI